MTKFIKILNNIDKYLTLTLLFSYPLFFLTFFPSAFESSKLLLLVSSVILISVIKVIKTLFGGDFKIKVSKLDFVVLGLGLTYVLSAIFVSPSKLDAFLLPGTASFVVFGSLLYFFINQINEGDKKMINISLSLSAVILAIISLLSFTGVVKDNFNSFGNLINSFTYLLIGFSFSIFEIFKAKKMEFKLFFGVASFLIFISAFTSLYSILPGKPTSPIFPNFKTGWSVAIDSLKQNPLVGVGPANFLYSYSKFRPVTSNSLNNWNDKYLVNSNTFLTVVSEVGILGFILFVCLFAFSLKNYKDLNSYKLSIIVVVLLSLIFPLTPSFLPLIFVLIALNNDPKEVSGVFNSKIPLFLILIPFIAVIIGLSFASYKVFYPEYLFGKALKLVAKNEAVNAYDAINKAVAANQYVDRYHLAAAQINMAIAQSLSKKDSLTDDDKKTLAQLIQQSIREGKAAVTLNPNKSSSWENLGDTYVLIAPFAKDANKYAIQSYNQAIFLDPISPLLRIKLGGISYGESDFEPAIKAFELAVLAKPDFANAHFNLAMAYKGNKQIEKAKAQMDMVLKLVDPNSNDYQLAKKERDAMDVKVEEKTKTESTEVPQTETLTPPVSPSPTVEPQVQI